VLFHLYLLAAASTDEKTIAVEVRAGEAVVASWERALGKDGGAAVGRLVDVGFVVTCPEGLRITIPARETAAKGREGAGAMVATLGSEERPQGAVAWQGKPSTSPIAMRARNDRALFKARAKGMWKLIDPALSWEEWVATPDGVAFLAEREREHPGYTRWVTPQGNAGNAQGNTPGNAPLLPPHTPLSSPKNEEKTQNGRAKGNTPKGNAGNTAGGVTLGDLRDAAHGVADLIGPTFERSVSRVLSEANLTRDEVAAMGRALATPSAWWTRDLGDTPVRVTLADLAGWRSGDGDGRHDCKPLLRLIGHVRAAAAARTRREAEERAAAEAAARRAPPPEDRPQITPEAQARIDEAKRRMKAALWTYGDPPLDGAKQ
jgi:hypothetical protein